MKSCPTCGQIIPNPNGPKRICARCQQPIRRHDRWHFGATGPMHNDCQMPEGAEAPAEAKQMMIREDGNA